MCFPGDEKGVRLYNINAVDLSLLLLLFLLLKLCLCLSEILDASSMHCLADSVKMLVLILPGCFPLLKRRFCQVLGCPGLEVSKSMVRINGL